MKVKKGTLNMLKAFNNVAIIGWEGAWIHFNATDFALKGIMEDMKKAGVEPFILKTYMGFKMKAGRRNAEFNAYMNAWAEKKVI